MEMKSLLKKLYLILFLPLAILISYIASKSPSIVEKLYSNTIYRFLGQTLSNITGVFSFSVGELLFVSIIIFFISLIIISIIKAVKNSKKAIYIFANLLLNMIIFISIAYFSFIIVWGLNYHRLPFSQIAMLDTKPTSISELVNLCEDLIERGNALRENVKVDSSGVTRLSLSQEDVFINAFKGYEKASKIYTELGGSYGRPKGVLLSRGLSISGISGIYFPFTSEANVNTDIPGFMLPCTTAHEMAHQRGFAREDEANFISYLTCNSHPNVDFQYSGTLLAIIHSMNTLYKYDKEKYIELRQTYSEGILRDLKFLSKFWEAYEGPVERASSKLNNAYLKSNYQEDGIYSYGRMVDLLLAEYRSKNKQND